jgi:MarR family transcriptional regulator for hemolysin
MDTVDPYESIGFHCSLTYRSFARALENRLRETGIKPSQFFVLSHLIALGAMPQGELAAYLSTSPVTIVKLIDRMERDGWVVRKPSVEDRRVKQVFLTKKAEAQWKDLTVIARSVIEQAHRGLAKKEINTVKNILNKIRNNLNT